MAAAHVTPSVVKPQKWALQNDTDGYLTAFDHSRKTILGVFFKAKQLGWKKHMGNPRDFP